MAAGAGTEKRKKTSSQKQREEEKREKAEKLNAQKGALESRLAAVDALRSGYSLPDLTGAEVEHMQYGSGKVLEQQGAVITVQYSDTVKKQKLPFVVAGGLLHLKEDGLEESMRQMDDLDKQMDTLRKEIGYIESLLGDLERI